MYVRVVTFRLSGSSDGEYVAHCDEIAAQFNEWPGLIAKLWLDGRTGGRFGGVYLFESAGAAASSRNTDLFRGLTSNPAFVDVQVEEFDTLPGPTATTARALLDRCGT
jgi:hypothetical protein